MMASLSFSATLLLILFLCVVMLNCSSDAFIIVPAVDQGKVHCYRERFPCLHGHDSNKADLTLSSENDDDDGWSDGDVEDETTTKRSRMATIASLQQERLEKSSSSSSSQHGGVVQTSSSAANDTEPVERDLFIPIFALVSLAGLFGAYGYEMLRLYSRGELYLPGGGGN